MMNLLFALCFFTSAMAQTSLDDLRWYLKPEGQEILISIDDLHDETVIAAPSMDWGYKKIPQYALKREVIVAVIDGGMEIDHPDLKDAIALNTPECFEGSIIPPMKEDLDGNGYKGDCAGWDFVENTNRAEDLDGHGTHVSGIIRMVTKVISGASVKLLPLRVFAPDEGRRTVKASAPLPVRLTKAFEYAMARKVDVIHMSVGWPKSFMSYELEQTIIKAQAQGIVIVSAAGNSSQRATIFPCQMKGVVCVGALRPNGETARFSNWGSQVDILGPGEKILSTIPHTIAPLHISRRGHDYKNGTSQAAPFISGALAILRGIYPDEPSDALVARLLLTADDSQKGESLRGLFHLPEAIELVPQSFVMPEFKGIHSIVVNEAQEFDLSLNFKNHWLAQQSATPGSVTCAEATLMQNDFVLEALASQTDASIKMKGHLKDVNTAELNCKISISGENFTLKLKVLKPFKKPLRSMRVKQSELLVVATRMGAKSRFMTLDTLRGAIARPLYYVPSAETISLFNLDQEVGAIPLVKGCEFLRMWQTDLNGDGENDVMVESTCDKTHLLYQFLDVTLKPIYPAVKYRPTLTNVNYEDFEVVPRTDGPPAFKFLNVGLSIPSSDPWESNVTTKKVHYYQLTPVKDGESFKFDISVLERPEQWAKSLGLRFLPSYRVFHLLAGKLLVQMGTKTAWVDLETQTATWAKLDDLLLLGSRKQLLFNSKQEIIQSFLTPYEYRGFVVAGAIKLRYQQSDRNDPLMDILGTSQTTDGYMTILRSFQHLIYIRYDSQGKQVSKTMGLVDRFDFLTAQDLISTVVTVVHDGKVIQLVDGTKVNTNYVDVMTDGKKESFEIPLQCATQQPVLLEGKMTLPVFCGKTKAEFEMRFVEL